MNYLWHEPETEEQIGRNSTWWTIKSAATTDTDEPTETLSNTYESVHAREWGIEIRQLVESGNIIKARQYLVRLNSTQIQRYNLENWLDLLGTPKASRGNTATGTRISRNISALLTKKNEYRGKWVAMQNGEYLDCNKSKVTLYRNLEKQNKLKNTTFIYIDN